MENIPEDAKKSALREVAEAEEIQEKILKLRHKAPEYLQKLLQKGYEKGESEDTLRNLLNLSIDEMLQISEPSWKKLVEECASKEISIPPLSSIIEEPPFDTIKFLLEEIRENISEQSSVPLHVIQSTRAKRALLGYPLLPNSWIDIMRILPGVQLGGLRLFGPGDPAWSDPSIQVHPQMTVFAKSGHGTRKILHVYGRSGRCYALPQDAAEAGNIKVARAKSNNLPEYILAVFPSAFNVWKVHNKLRQKEAFESNDSSTDESTKTLEKESNPDLVSLSNHDKLETSRSNEIQEVASLTKISVKENEEIDILKDTNSMNLHQDDRKIKNASIETLNKDDNTFLLTERQDKKAIISHIEEPNATISFKEIADKKLEQENNRNNTECSLGKENSTKKDPEIKSIDQTIETNTFSKWNDAQRRKARSERIIGAALKEFPHQDIPPSYNDDAILIRQPSAIIWRCRCLLAITAWASDFKIEDEARLSDISTTQIEAFLGKEMHEQLTPEEALFLSHIPTQKEKEQEIEKIDALAVLLRALGILKRLPPPDQAVDSSTVFNLGFNALIKQTKEYSLSIGEGAILDLLDLYRRLDWMMQNSDTNTKKISCNILHQRRHALEWLISSLERPFPAWNEVDLSIQIHKSNLQ